MTYKEISKKYNISISILTRRVHLLSIKGLFKGREISFNKKQVQQILDYNPRLHFEKMCNKNHPRKFRIIEFYLKRRSGRKVAEFLNMSRHIVDATIREFNETGCIVVASKMNKEITN